jgi:16S rRNA (guanine527-N7)-methyltransferase
LPDSIADILARHGLHVSRETSEKLNIYNTLLLKWQKAINLVSPTTMAEAGVRHFYDSAQLFRYIPDPDVRLADMGSGAGFPGLVLALLGVRQVHLIESDVRKATFLREVSRETGVAVTVHDIRVEDCKIPGLDVVTARALAPLRHLLEHMDHLATPGHECYGLFAKGAQYEEELVKARKQWGFDLESFNSETEPEARILRIRHLQHKQ